VGNVLTDKSGDWMGKLLEIFWSSSVWVRDRDVLYQETKTKLSEVLGRQPGLSSFCGYHLEQFYLNKSIFK